MAHGDCFRRRITRIAAAGSVVALLGVGGVALTSASSGAATFSCPNFNDTDVPPPPAGMTGYLFIGTSVSTATSTITVTFDGGQQVMVPGVQEGNGAFHYIVNLPQGAVVSNATVTGATDNTVVTVSGCLNGPPAPPATTSGPGPSVTPGGTQVSPEVVTRAPTQAPTPAAAVTGAARFTG
jgi:hypothetical protein